MADGPAHRHRRHGRRRRPGGDDRRRCARARARIRRSGSPSTATSARSRPRSPSTTNLAERDARSSTRPSRSPPSEKPSQAIRRARTTSMGMAINAVKDGVADAALSGGNTGALMAMSKLALRTMPGIDRPALAALLPTLGENDVHHARPRRQHRVRRAEPGPVRGDGRGLCALRARHRAAAREAAQHRHRGTEGHRRAQGRRRAAARGRLSAVPLRRLHRGRPAVARRGRRRRHRRLLRQYRAQDRRRHRALRHRSAAPRLHQLAPVEGRLRAVAAGAQPAARSTSIPTITTARSSSASTAWS